MYTCSEREARLKRLTINIRQTGAVFSKLSLKCQGKTSRQKKFGRIIALTMLALPCRFDVFFNREYFQPGDRGRGKEKSVFGTASRVQ